MGIERLLNASKVSTLMFQIAFVKMELLGNYSVHNSDFITHNCIK